MYKFTRRKNIVAKFFVSVSCVVSAVLPGFAMATPLRTTGPIQSIYSADKLRNCFFVQVNNTFYAVPTSDVNFRTMVNTIMLARALGTDLDIHYEAGDTVNCYTGPTLRITYVGFS
jgi:hypothetical protein